MALHFFLIEFHRRQLASDEGCTGLALLTIRGSHDTNYMYFQPTRSSSHLMRLVTCMYVVSLCVMGPPWTERSRDLTLGEDLTM